MNYLAIQELIKEYGYTVKYMGMNYSTDLIPIVNIELKKNKETLNFNLQCSSLDDLAGETQSLAGFMDWLIDLT